MAKPHYVMSLIDGFCLAVKVTGDRVIAKLCLAERTFGEDGRELKIFVREPVFCQQFDLAGLPWRSRDNEELLTEWLEKKMTAREFRRFAQKIVQLAQEFDELCEAHERLAAA